MSVQHTLPTHEQVMAGVIPDFPPQTIVSVANPCNAECPSCPMTNVDEIRKSYGSPFIREDHLRAIAQEIGDHNSVLRITGTGEPFLHKYLTDLLAFACEVGCRVGVINNGSRLDAPRLERLLAAGRKGHTVSIEFSVDAHTPNVYAIVRPGLKFDVLQRNIKDAIEIRNRLQWNLAPEDRTRIIVSIIDQPHLNPDIPGSKKYWEDFGADVVLIRKYQTWGVQQKIHLSVPQPDTQVKREPCPYPFDRMNIDTDGYFRLCPYDIVNSERSLRGKLGHIETSTIKAAWQGSLFKQIRGWHLGGQFEKLPICHQCDDFPVKLTSWGNNYWTSLAGASAKLREQR